MTSAAAFFSRWRVRLGYPLAIAVFCFARPIPLRILLGACVGAIGLCVRAFAAGYLRKQETLTVTGPYAYTRNPLYFGSAILAAGLALAANSWASACLLIGYFALFYPIVMRREGEELRRRFGSAFEDYARAVPLFLPRLKAPAVSNGGAAFSWAQYRKNREYQATIGFALILGLLVLLWGVRFP